MPAFRLALLSVLPLAALAGAAAAQTRPSLDCSNSSGVAEAMVCSDANLGASDGRLAGHVDTVIETLEARGEGSEEAVAAFRESQQDWAEARDACARSTDPRRCVADAYASREAELVATFQLAEPSDAVSYSCSGQAGGGLSISFYDLDRPAVRIEGAGDEALTGTADMSAGKARNARQTGRNNGARYTLSSGQEVWVRKDVARFTLADGATVTCEIDRR